MMERPPVIVMTWPMFLRSECRVDGRLVLLTAQQADIVLTLLLVGPTILSVNELIERIWPDPDLEPDAASKGIDMQVHRCRVAGVPIETVWGRGVTIPAENRAPSDTPRCCRSPRACQYQRLLFRKDRQRFERNRRFMCQRCANQKRGEETLMLEVSPILRLTLRYMMANPGATQRQMAAYFGVHQTTIDTRMRQLAAKRRIWTVKVADGRGTGKYRAKRATKVPARGIAARG